MMGEYDGTLAFLLLLDGFDGDLSRQLNGFDRFSFAFKLFCCPGSSAVV